MPHFFLKLIPQRKSFAADMTDAEKDVMARHAAYEIGHYEIYPMPLLTKE